MTMQEQERHEAAWRKLEKWFNCKKPYPDSLRATK